MKRALVLAGGGARGAYQVGMLQELVINQGIDFDVLRGVSVGALNASFLSMARSTSNSLQNLQQQVNQLTHIWTTEIQGNQSVYAERPGGFVGIATGADSLFSLEPLRRLLARYLHLPALQTSGRDFAVGTVSLVSGRYRESNPSDPRFLELVLASASIPVVFPFVNLDNDVLVDGGVRNITPLSSAFDAKPDEVYVLLTSKLEPTAGGELPDSAAPKQEYEAWDDNWLGTKVSGLTVLKRAVELLTDEVYLDDLRGALEWNRTAKQIAALSQATKSQTLPGAVKKAMQALEGATSKRHVPLYILAPREWYGTDNGSTDFTPKHIQSAIEHGRMVAKDKSLWVVG